MKTYVTVAIANFAAGTVLGLDAAQATARKHVLKVIKPADAETKKRGVYQAIEAVQFKIGETVGLEHEPSKAMADELVTPEEAAKRAKAEQAAKAEQSAALVDFEAELKKREAAAYAQYGAELKKREAAIRAEVQADFNARIDLLPEPLKTQLIAALNTLPADAASAPPTGSPAGGKADTEAKS